ncbi:unnamed protein product [Prunus brigantina]
MERGLVFCQISLSRMMLACTLSGFLALCAIFLQFLSFGLWKRRKKTLKKLQAMETSLSREVLTVIFFRFMSIPFHFEFQGLKGIVGLVVMQIVSELIICCKKAFPDLLDSPGEDGLDADDAPAVIMDVLVDTLLSLMPQSSAPMLTSIELV